VHIDSLDPATFDRWYDFLELYVARQKPALSPAVKGFAPTIYSTAMGVQNVTLPDDPIQSEPTYAAALAAFQALPQVRIRFDNGAGGSQPGAPVEGFEQSFSRFPIPGTTAHSWYLADGGSLADAKQSAAGSDKFTWNRTARPAVDLTGDPESGPGGLWTASPAFNWTQNPPGTAASYITAPLTANTVVVGAGALQTWIKSPSPDVDLQVTVSEVRPDGNETYVQSGWLRASGRKLDPRKSTLLEPVPSFTRKDSAPLPRDKFAKVIVPLYYEGHAYRAGSRIRVTISAPSGDQPVWAFGRAVPRGTTSVTVGHGAAMPSRLVLPVVPGVNVPTGLPPCPGLRGEPCRPYQPPS
jgi:hypothetical protein